MPKLTIDNREVDVPPGATVLDAARKLGIDIPALCHREGCEPSTSCLVCMVKVGKNHRLVPSCATAAAEGMEVESETEDVREVRRSALELLLSDHLGDCLAPCMLGCPAQMDIPRMLRQIAAGDLRGAIATVKADIALPAVLGRICPAPCEKVCRRSGVGGPVTICLLKRFVADVDLQCTLPFVVPALAGGASAPEPYLPPCHLPTGKRVAIVGGGPTGLAAAYYLAQQGHTCTIFDENEQLGGRLRREPDDRLPADLLDAEIATITQLGIEVCADTRVGEAFPFAELHSEFDAVLVACGTSVLEQAEAWGLPHGPHGIPVSKHTYETGAPAVFAAGQATRGGKAMVVRSVADGKEAAAAIDQFLSGRAMTGPAHQFTTKIGRMEADELAQMANGASSAPRCEAGGGKGDRSNLCAAPEGPFRQIGPVPFSAASGYALEEAVEQAARCMHCDCRGLHTCKLRHYAALYGADPRRYKAERRHFQQDATATSLSPSGRGTASGARGEGIVIYEPGKCIDCGLCIQIAAASGERLGLTFIGRGFNVRVGVPLGHTLAEALVKVAAECVAACPTAALAWKVES